MNVRGLSKSLMAGPQMVSELSKTKAAIDNTTTG